VATRSNHGKAAARQRDRRRAKSDASPLSQAPFKQPRRTFKPMELLDEGQLDKIHTTSLRVLEDIGVEILLPEARDLLQAAGALVDGERVRIGGDVIEQAISTAPSQFIAHARNPEHSITIGGDYVTFCPVGGPPNCSDMDSGRRPGTLADNANFIRLAQFFNSIHMSAGGAVDALDIHASVRHLHIGRNKALLSDKLPFASSTSRERLHDGVEMARISRGIDHEQLLREASCFTVINTNSPLKIDASMAMGLIEMARLNQISCVTPFTLAGAMAPVTMAGALVEQNAEALAGIAITQLANPGAPTIYGGFTSNVDMKSGAPAFGTPEYMKAAVIGGQLARRYNIPYRTSASCAANAVDAQAAYETVFALWGAIMGGGHLIIHAAGWMEGGLVASFEKFALDTDLLQMVAEFMVPLDLSDDALGFDAIKEVGPGGHFFGAAQTLARYDTAFHAPNISDWRNFEQWQAAGSPEAKDHARALYKRALDEYQRPPMDLAVRDELRSFVERRIGEGGSPTDF
jgi:trimethylamine--corrinoid protein Co-methyltransferase